LPHKLGITRLDSDRIAEKPGKLSRDKREFFGPSAICQTNRQKTETDKK